MAADNLHSQFLQLPVEIRNIIYDHVFSEDNSSKSAAARIRRGYDKACYSAVLAVNQQINLEASRVMYGQTFTITVSEHGIVFLGFRYRILSASLTDFFKAFPFSFPFHKIKELRIRIETSTELDNPIPWYLLEKYLDLAGEVLKKIDDEGYLKKLIIDAWEPCAYHKPWMDRQHMDIRRCFSTLGHQSQLKMVNPEHCEIRLPSWAKTCPTTIRIAKDWARAAILGHGPLKLALAGPSRDSVTAVIHTNQTSSARQHDVSDPIILVKDTNCENGHEPKEICPNCKTDYTRL